MDHNEQTDRITKVDLRKVFRDKNPRLAPYLPGFVYRYLNHILHVREINEFLAVHGEKTGIAFAEAAIQEFNVTVTFKGEEHLPGEGRFMFVSNHPLGGFDGMILLRYLAKKYGNVKTISNDILMNIANIKSLFVPVNKHGMMSRESAKALDDLLQSDIQVMTFPAGFVSRKNHGVIRDIKWQKSFISKSIQHKREVIPVHFSGRCTNFFYNLASIRKFLGLKTNIEMFFLPDESFKHKNKHFTVTFGQPVHYSVFTREKTHEEWALSIQDYVYSMAEGNDKPFDPNQ